MSVAVKANSLCRPDTIVAMDTVLCWSYQILLDTVLLFSLLLLLPIQHKVMTWLLLHTKTVTETNPDPPAVGLQHQGGLLFEWSLPFSRHSGSFSQSKNAHIRLLISPLNCLWEGLCVWPVLQWGSVQSVFLPLTWPQLGLQCSPWPWLGLSSQRENRGIELKGLILGLMACSELENYVFCFDFSGWKCGRKIINFWLKQIIATVCRPVLLAALPTS